MADETASPSMLGFRMPAEWEMHERTWMGWPERPDNWREGAKPAQQAFVAVAKAISQFEPVTVCANAAQVALARAVLPRTIEVAELPQDDAWFRDTGPTFLVRAGCPSPDSLSVAGVDWRFNAWGGIYDSWKRDEEVAKRILEKVHVPRFACPMVLEGGSIHVDGEGTLITTEECLLHPNRNPNLSKDDIEAWLCRMTGATKVIWLPRGLYGDDDTNGHVDNLACFARPGVVLLSWTDDPSDPQNEISQEALRTLSSATDAKGRRIEVIKLPLPPPMYRTAEDVESVQEMDGVMAREEGSRLAASYANFYICNGGVVMPGLGHSDADARAKAVVEAAFPGRRVVQVQTREVLCGGGNIHCITQQQPAAPMKPDVFPVVGAVVVACGFAVYSIARNIMTNPEVHITKASRMEGVPESGVTEARAAGYKDSVYRSLQAKKENTKIFG